MDWGNGDIVALSAGNVKKGFIDFNLESYLGSEALYKRWMRNGDTKKGDIVFTLEAPLGNVVLIPDERKYILSQRTILLQPKNTISSEYVFQTLISDSFQKSIYDKANGSTAQGIKRQIFEKVQIPFPPLAEQKAIAAVLSDVDAWIKSLEQLIVKKRLIKQGAMQSLLTPSESWEVKKLGEVFSITAGGDLSKYEWNDIKTDEFVYEVYSNSLTNKGLYCYSSSFSSGSNVITVTARGSVGFAVARFNKFLAIGRLLCLEPKFALSIKYFEEFINNKISFANESTGVPQLTAPQIATYKIPYPSISEQERIATILSDMDTELEVLENQLNKARQIKQGMMQELLTGRVRLV